MSNTSETENNTSICANCGKGEEAGIDLKSCAACKLVKYCSRDCQLAHRSQHKKACKRRAKELHDEKLFKQPPPLEDCPICFLRMPHLTSVQVYMACCGKVMCRGCVYAFQSRVSKKEESVCPFCRVPAPSSNDELVQRYKNRAELNDAVAIRNLGSFYRLETYGFPQNYAKALELFHRAAELGDSQSYYSIGNAYEFGRGVGVDKKKAIHYWELAAMEGNVDASFNLGVVEGRTGNMDRALKHFMNAIEGGYADSLEKVRDLYSWGIVTKDVYAKAQQVYQAYVDEIKSDQRDEAAAFREDWRYYGFLE